MNTSTSRGFARRPVMALAAAVTLVLGFSAPVHETKAWGIVYDPTIWFSNFMEYGTEAMRWKDQLDMMKQQMLQIQQLAAQIGLPPNQSLQRITNPDTYMVAENCGGGAVGKILGDLVKIQSDQDIYKQQQGICARIQQARNYKYNEMADYMTTTMKQMDDEVQRTRGMRNSSSTSGENDGASSANGVLANDLKVKADKFNATMNMYDNYIATLEATQRALAQQALKGRRANVVGHVMKAAIMQEALEPRAMPKRNR